MMLTMGSDFVGLSLDEILRRLLRSGYDLACYRELANHYFHREDASLKCKAYESLGKAERQKGLRALAGDVSHSTKFRGYSWEEVILEGVSEVVPAKWFNIIFGHVNNEEELYPLVRRFLRHKYSHADVIDTFDHRSKVGVRYADFTVVGGGLLGKSLLSVDVKVDVQAFDYFLNQASDFLAFSDKAYLLCTPGLILKAGRKWGKLAGVERTFTNKLRTNGVGVYVMDAETHNVKLLSEAHGSSILEKEKRTKALDELGFK